ncbi:MAG TPA: NHL repeat-containing protein [Gammaproteobacteria bacterium]|nr:NHL repeat-containing protein [Gammaproteobacteria bacterium]
MSVDRIAENMKCRHLLPLIAALVVAGLGASAGLAAAPAGTPCTLCLYGPDNMAFDAAGDVYLVDSDHKTRSRVLKLSPEGKKLAEWHVFPLIPGRDNGPNGIGLDADGNILVADAQGVLKLSSTGSLLTTFGTQPETFDDERHLAVGRQGDIFVTQAHENLIQRFSPDGRLVASWKRGQGSGREQLNRPEQISAAPDGNLVVQDWGNHRMVTLSPAGRTVSTFDATKDVPLKLASISGACVDQDGNIYVADYQLYRVQEFDPHGRLLTTIQNTPGNVLFETAPYSLAIDLRGNLYSGDGLSVVKYSRDGKLLARWR